VPPPAGTADRTLMVLVKAPIRSRPPDRMVGETLERRRPTVHSKGTKPVTDSGSDRTSSRDPFIIERYRKAHPLSEPGSRKLFTSADPHHANYDLRCDPERFVEGHRTRTYATKVPAL
jgi:hypothetical protein